MNAVLALGLVSSGSCNSKVNTHLKQVVDAERLYASLSSGELAQEKAFFIHFAQGLTGLGRVGLEGRFHGRVWRRSRQ